MQFKYEILRHVNILRFLAREEANVHLNILSPLNGLTRRHSKQHNVGLQYPNEFGSDVQPDGLDAPAILKQLKPTLCCDGDTGRGKLVGLYMMGMVHEVITKRVVLLSVTEPFPSSGCTRASRRR